MLTSSATNELGKKAASVLTQNGNANDADHNIITDVLNNSSDIPVNNIKNNCINKFKTTNANVPFTLLEPDEEIDKIIITATHPYKYFRLPLTTYSLITVECQECNTSGRCQLLMSCTHPFPSMHSASWCFTSANSMKQFKVHPADDNYTLGNFYLALRYLEHSGSTVVRLRVHLESSFTSVWLRRSLHRTMPVITYKSPTSNTAPLPSLMLMSSGSPFQASKPISAICDNSEISNEGAPQPTCISLYCGQWKGNHYHGRGVILYEVVNSVHDGNADIALPLQKVAFSESIDASFKSETQIGQEEATTINGHYVLHTNTHCCEENQNRELCSYAEHPPQALSLFTETVLERPCLPCSMLTLPIIDAVNNNTNNLEIDYNVHDNSTSSVVGNDDATSSLHLVRLRELRKACGMPEEVEWESAQGWRLLTPLPQNVEAYDGEWNEHAKHGKGIYQWTDRAYIGEWQNGVRHGHGVLYCADGSWFNGQWMNDVRHGYGEAMCIAEQVIYRGSWAEGKPNGSGVMVYINTIDTTTSCDDNKNEKVNTSDGVQVHGTWLNGTLQPEVTVIYPNGETYVGGWRNRMRHGKGTLTDHTGCQHHHYWSHDKREGEGEKVMLLRNVCFRGKWRSDAIVNGAYYFPDGSVYCGTWNDEEQCRHGDGRCVYANGDVYNGQWEHDKRHGRGVMEYTVTHATYDGDWVNDQRDGEGKLTEANGNVYTGHFVQDQRCGYGEQQETNGSYYRGNWQNNFKSGFGVYYNALQNITYEGMFLHDCLHGSGSCTDPMLGEEYVGTWLDGHKQGNGTVRFANGDTLRGIWHRGVHESGEITFHYASGEHYMGNWRDGKPHGHGVRFNNDNSVYDGAWEHGIYHGHGTLIKSNGESICGQWVHGQLADGEGEITFMDGSVYCGVLCNGTPHGQGKLTYPDGTVFDGKFSNGIYVLESGIL